jgi:predicted CxxxxCH...CXXCH cytochrome family protein
VAVQGADANVKAAPPSTATGASPGAHQAHVNGGAATPLHAPYACAECHVVPTSVPHSNGTVDVAFGAGAKVGGASPTWSAATHTCASTYCHGNFTNGNRTNAPTWTSAASGACGTCHAIPPAGTHPTLPAGTNCGACHTGYDATPGSTNGTVNLANHVNGQVDVGGGGGGGGASGESAGGSSCGGCHNTIFSMMNGSVAKATKHTLASDVPNDTGGTWSGNLKSATPYAAASCVSMCHGDHPHSVTTGGTHEYNVYADANARSTTSGSSTRAKTDFDAALTNGGLCVSCHQNPVDASHPAISKAGFQAAAHNFTSNTVGATTYTWQYTLHDGGAFQRNCTKCHASQAEGDSPTIAVSGSGTVGPHASDFGSLLAGATNPGTTPANLVCYNCHGNGTTGQNVSGNDIATAVARGGGHAGINSDTRHGTASEDATTWNSGALSGANRHVSCLDCHDTHLAGKTNHTVGPNDGAITATSPLNGVSGVGYTATLPANWATTAAANLQKVNPATAEWQVCFKCHSSWAFGTTPPTGTSGLAETDLAQEFNPNNASAHPVVNTLNNQAGSTGTKGLVAAQLLAPWNANPGNQTMTCTDCHNTDAASPAAQGPHGSAVVFMLSGTNKAWPYTAVGTSGTLRTVSTSETNLGAANGLFCRNCHPQQNSTSSNALHRLVGGAGSQHNSNFFTCVGCHIRVPHGGKVSRLIVTTNAPARYKVPSSVTMVRFQKVAKDSYGWANFGRSCGQHSGTGLASGESW